MQNNVIKIGGVLFLSPSEKNVIKRVLNSDFEINDDFIGNKSRLPFDSKSTIEQTQDGIQVKSNIEDNSIEKVNIYLCKYRKNSCSWGDIVFYREIENAENVILNQWDYLYTNDQYCVYRFFSTDFPSSLPLDGELPPTSVAPFIKYESFTNIWLRDQCEFKYENPVMSLVDSPGNDEWVLSESGDTECTFSYIKSTPFGCDLYSPSSSDIEISEECSCIKVDLSSSSSDSSELLMSTSSSGFSESSSDSSDLSDLNSSSSEIRMSTKNIETIYIRIVGEPFVAYEYVLKLQNSDVYPIVWKADTHLGNTYTYGTISLSMNESGRFSLSLNALVNDSRIVIENALLSNVRNDNFSKYTNYIKGLSPVCSEYITTKHEKDDGSKVLSYDCIISYETLKRTNGDAKSLSEIIYDYEMAELSVDTDAEKINLYFGKANKDNDLSENICRAWGLFCLDNDGNGRWSYSNEDQEIYLNKTDGGYWTLHRKYKNSPSDSQEIYLEIDPMSISSNMSGEYDGFVGASVVRKSLIFGGVEEASINDVCNDTDSVLVFYSSDYCGQDSSYNPYNGDLLLTIDGGWEAKKDYVLSPSVINENLIVWNWSSESYADDFKYAVLFSQDGILWKLMVFNSSSSSRDYFFAEFIKENKNSDHFSTVFQKVHKSYASINGKWSNSDITISITEK